MGRYLAQKSTLTGSKEELQVGIQTPEMDDPQFERKEMVPTDEESGHTPGVRMQSHGLLHAM